MLEAIHEYVGSEVGRQTLFVTTSSGLLKKSVLSDSARPVYAVMPWKNGARFTTISMAKRGPFFEGNTAYTGFAKSLSIDFLSRPQEVVCLAAHLRRHPNHGWLPATPSPTKQ